MKVGLSALYAYNGYHTCISFVIRERVEMFVIQLISNIMEKVIMKRRMIDWKLMMISHADVRLEDVKMEAAWSFEMMVS
jgi:hypothetical protein